MSRMTITRYRDLEAERRRAEQRQILRARKELQLCLQLERELGGIGKFTGLNRLMDAQHSLERRARVRVIRRCGHRGGAKTWKR